MNCNNDYILTAISNDGNVIGYFSSTKESATLAQKSHSMNIVSSALFAQAMNAVVLLSGNLKNKEDYLSATWNCTGNAKKIYVESDYLGNTRGFIENTNLEYIEDSITDNGFNSEPYLKMGEISVLRQSFSGKAPYNSVVLIETGEIPQDISLFLEQSLQVQSIISIGLSISEHNYINASGGLLIMGLPGVTEIEMKNVYDKFSSLGSVRDLLLKEKHNVIEFFNSLDMSIIDEKPVQFQCRCTEEKVLQSLKKLDDKELNEFLNKNNQYEVCCHYCNKQYSINKNFRSM
ncbi:MAG: hypothetical protein A2015_10080 [Spirochaetes bacterium GWF1_31_7]|nr:MAG: hypothetical protein A2Y30_16415 [Spirochaetes bacterium GWE1_32_154]OHD48558.1 MAG: hypothetical protein A2Y29_14390 [Spirochaetes bacterium GWE2_31_10]OHD52186.1 MAG: hypothetical protein A2015_10080 [Spirochaetes bacterium GWF1_31_7]OHD78448.1 MAG: hypothetical protein A2355_09220 [Spirochaetes bacterium RIFOXYB1_FULL_32_8]